MQRWILSSSFRLGLIIVLAGLARAASAAPELWPLTSKELSTRLRKPDVKATVVNLWATWCEPCKQEMPELLKFKRDYEAKGVKLLLIDADSAPELPEAAKFLETLSVTFEVFHLGEEPDKFMKPFDAHWPATIPTTMVFDANGKRIGYWVGRIKIKELSTAVEKALLPRH